MRVRQYALRRHATRAAPHLAAAARAALRAALQNSLPRLARWPTRAIRLGAHTRNNARASRAPQRVAHARMAAARRKHAWRAAWRRAMAASPSIQLWRGSGAAAARLRASRAARAATACRAAAPPLYIPPARSRCRRARDKRRVARVSYRVPLLAGGAPYRARVAAAPLRAARRATRCLPRLIRLYRLALTQQHGIVASKPANALRRGTRAPRMPPPLRAAFCNDARHTDGCCRCYSLDARRSPKRR